jgi:hypothetical protein
MSKMDPRHVRYHWFRLSLVLGTLLAILMFVNSVINYAFVSRRIALEQLQRDMNKQAVTLEQEIRRTNAQTPAQYERLIDEMQKREKTVWIEIRDRDDNVLAFAGLEDHPRFTQDEIRPRIKNHEPVFAVRSAGGGNVAMQAMPLHVPWVNGDQRGVNQRGPGAILEIGMSLDRARSVFWPVRQNLIINCSAAVALLAALAFMGLRFKSYLQGRQLEQQVEIARKVQQDLLPSGRQVSRRIELSAECRPAWGVGGDFYDTFETPEGRVAIVLGDVSGKGIPAALLMGVIHGAVRSSSWTENAWHHEESSRRINQLLCERASGERYASLFWGYYDPTVRRLYYVNAGHCSPLLVRRVGDVPVIQPLDEGGPVLGLLPSARYRQGAIDLAEGDVLVMFSDGVVEAMNEAGEEFGEQRLRDAILAAAREEVTGIRSKVLQAVDGFVGSAAPHDDLTIAAVRFEVAAAAPRESNLVAA